MDRHEFVDSGERYTDARGRNLRICSVCWKAKLGRGFHIQPIGPTEKHPRVRVTPAPKRMRSMPPRELRMLALALDTVIAMPIDAIGWRVYVRSMDLRAAITSVPRDPQDKPIEQMDKPTPTADVSELQPEILSHAVRSRAKASTKGIRDTAMREAATFAVAQGWVLARTPGGHFKLSKGKDHVIFGGTPGDHRAYMNMRATLRRKGLAIE